MNTDRTAAYPTPAAVQHSDGMELRDWFAGQIAAGDASASEEGSGWTNNMKVLPEYAAKRAAVYYAIADAMMAERLK